MKIKEAREQLLAAFIALDTAGHEPVKMAEAMGRAKYDICAALESLGKPEPMRQLRAAQTRYLSDQP